MPNLKKKKEEEKYQKQKLLSQNIYVGHIFVMDFVVNEHEYLC